MTFEQWVEDNSERNFAEWDGRGYVWVNDRQLEVLGENPRDEILWINGHRLRRVQRVPVMRASIYTKSWSLLAIMAYILRAEIWWLHFRHRLTATLHLWHLMGRDKEIEIPFNDYLRHIDNKINEVMGRR